MSNWRGSQRLHLRGKLQENTVCVGHFWVSFVMVSMLTSPLIYCTFTIATLKTYHKATCERHWQCIVGPGEFLLV